MRPTCGTYRHVPAVAAKFSDAAFGGSEKRFPLMIPMYGLAVVNDLGPAATSSDELHQGLNSEVGEGHDAVFADAIDPDDAVRDFHLVGEVPHSQVLIFAEILGYAIDCGDVMD
jgi:hypothetical protein